MPLQQGHAVELQQALGQLLTSCLLKARAATRGQNDGAHPDSAFPIASHTTKNDGGRAAQCADVNAPHERSNRSTPRTPTGGATLARTDTTRAIPAKPREPPAPALPATTPARPEAAGPPTAPTADSLPPGCRGPRERRSRRRGWPAPGFQAAERRSS